jgi:hypothetical protein
MTGVGGRERVERSQGTSDWRNPARSERLPCSPSKPESTCAEVTAGVGDPRRGPGASSHAESCPCTSPVSPLRLPLSPLIRPAGRLRPVRMPGGGEPRRRRPGLVGGTVITVDAEVPDAEAVAIRDGRILAVGTPTRSGPWPGRGHRGGGARRARGLPGLHRGPRALPGARQAPMILDLSPHHHLRPDRGHGGRGGRRPPSRGLDHSGGAGTRSAGTRLPR